MTATRDRDRYRHRPRRAVHQHDPHARDGRRAEGELRAPRDADGAGAARVHALHAGHAPQPGERRRGPNRDRFVLSCGHASMLLYSIALPLRLRAQPRATSRTSASSARRAPDTPSTAHAPGIEATTGPARPGHLELRRPGARRADAGGALQPRRATRSSTTTPSRSPPTATSRRASRPRPSSLAGHLGLGRLIAFYDDNHISIEGDTALAFSEDVGARYEAYGWHVQRPRRGHRGRHASSRPREAAMAVDGPPVADHLPHPHRRRLAEQARHRRARTARRSARRRSGSTKERYGWPTEPSRSTSRPRRSSTAARRSRAARSPSAEWRERFAAYRAGRTPSWPRSSRRSSRGAPRAAGGLLEAFHAAGTKIATRKASQEVLQVAAAQRARAGRRLGRPGALDAHADRRRRTRRARRATAGATCTSASASTRWARSSTASLH